MLVFHLLAELKPGKKLTNLSRLEQNHQIRYPLRYRIFLWDGNGLLHEQKGYIQFPISAKN